MHTFLLTPFKDHGRIALQRHTLLTTDKVLKRACRYINFFILDVRVFIHVFKSAT